MGVYALTSLSGAPGVTTTAVAWAQLSDRPTLIIEADVTGGSPILAGVFDGTMLHRNSLLALASAEPQDWIETIWRQAVPLPDRITTRTSNDEDHTNTGERIDRWVLPAIGRGHQARAMAPLWPTLAHTLNQISRNTGVDVVIDAGRLGTPAGPWDLIAAADAVLLLTDTTIPSLTRIAVALESLRKDLSFTGSPARLGLVPIVGPSQMTRPWSWLGRDSEPDIRPYTHAEIAATFTPTAVVSTIPHAPRAAATYLHDRPHLRDGTGYNAAIRTLISATTQHARAYAALLDPAQEDAS